MGCSANKSKVVDEATAKESTKKAEEAPLVNNEDIRDKYEIGKVLGSGSFGQVREATLKENSDVRAVKMIERDNEDGEWSNQAIFVREVGLLQQIKHENIIRYFDFYEDPHFLYVVMELCRGGEVFAKIVELKRFSEKNAAFIGQQMLKALEYIHGLSIAHRDIKAENFMLSDDKVNSNVKMIDFGMATKYEPEQVLTELCGSPHYLAPELIGQKYNHLADVWALGILFYLLMYGHYPYDAKHPRDIMVKILTEPIPWQTKAKLSKDALNFLKRLLEHNPRKRMTADQALDHPWIKSGQQVLTTQKTSEVDPNTNLLNVETARSAQKKVTATRKILDPKIDEIRNQKLKRMDEDFKKGIRHGQRLGETPKEEFMSKPEFLRRENKITTAPSRDLNTRRESLQKLVGGMFRGGSKKINEMEAIQDEDGEGGEDKVPEIKPRTQVRSHSLTAPSLRRLSYIGNISQQEEKNLASLYQEKQESQKGQSSPGLTGIVPEPKEEAPSAANGTGEQETIS